MTRNVLLGLVCFATTCFPVLAQQATQPQWDDRKIDLFFGDWRDSMPRSSHGSLIERDILTRGSLRNPPVKGAVLECANRFVYAELSPHGSTSPVTLQGEQEIFYFVSGTGSMSAAGQTVEVREDTAVLVPVGLEYVLKNTSDKTMTMYLVVEPVPPGFKANKKLLARVETNWPIASTTGHWVHIVKRLFTTADGLATVYDYLTVTFDPMTMGEPHGQILDNEEVWMGLKGESAALLGKQLRKQGPGVAYVLPMTEVVTFEPKRDDVARGLSVLHGNINVTNERIKMLFYIASVKGKRYLDSQGRPQIPW